MKKLVIVALALLIVVGVVYTSNGQTVVVRNHAADQQLDEQQLIAALDGPLSELATGIADRDAALIFGIFGDPERSRYVRDGAIYDSIAEAEETYARRFARQDASVVRTFEFRTREYDIINAGTVLFTGIGVLESAGPGVEEAPWEIAYTILWVLGNDGWKAVNMHISWE